jgi:hypothetical protein
MISIVLIFILLGITDMNSSSLSDCPSVSVSCVSENCLRSPAVFRVSITGNDASQKLKYRWTVVHGRIEEGQGTPTIKVITEKNSSVTATVEVSGLPEECVTAASFTTIYEPLPTVKKSDEFGNISFADLQKH